MKLTRALVAVFLLGQAVAADSWMFGPPELEPTRPTMQFSTCEEEISPQLAELLRPSRPFVLDWAAGHFDLSSTARAERVENLLVSRFAEGEPDVVAVPWLPPGASSMIPRLVIQDSGLGTWCLELTSLESGETTTATLGKIAPPPSGKDWRDVEPGPIPLAGTACKPDSRCHLRLVREWEDTPRDWGARLLHMTVEVQTRNTPSPSTGGADSDD